jgi:hypothetical protein
MEEEKYLGAQSRGEFNFAFIVCTGFDLCEMLFRRIYLTGFSYVTCRVTEASFIKEYVNINNGYQVLPNGS